MSLPVALPMLCWERSSVLDIIPIEAESPPDSVFKATHSNLAIYRRSSLESNDGVIVQEGDLLAAVDSQPGDLPIIPILGNSGTGKSHLVRWLRMELQGQQHPRTNRRVIFVPKHKMSLRAILDLILDQADSIEADEFRQRVHDATEQLASEKDARNRLRATLSYLLAESPSNTVHSVAAEKVERDYLAGSLPSLLDDPVFKTRLLADDGALARLSTEKFSGKSTEDKEDPFEFAAEDLRLTVDDTNRASADARDIAEVLGGDLGLRELAATMLNEQLAPAVSSVFGVGGDDLKNLLIDLRIDLAKSGEEILLLIEDFSIFQGVQGGLIDAMTQIPTAENPLCAMKVVMAVTTGYFRDQVPDTAKTRTYCAFDLDVPDSAHTTDLPSFVAPYLNAVRVGAHALERTFADHEPTPNACDDCPIMGECHSAFGSHAGIGLYPFNAFALARTVRSRQSDAGVFVARNVLKDVVRPVLQDDRDAIANSRFPSAEFEKRFPIHVNDIEWNVEETAQIRNPGESDDLVNRRRRLLTFYAPHPAPQNLDVYIHESLAIPVVPGLPAIADIPMAPATSARVPADRGNRSRPTTPTSPISSRQEDPALVQAVDAWSRGQALQQGPQNELRKLVFNAVAATFDFDDGLQSSTSWTITASGSSADRVLSGSRRFGPTSIFLEGTKQKDLSGTRIDIKREDIEAVRVVRALAYLDAGTSWSEIDRGAGLQRLATRQIAKWACEIEEQFGVPRDDPSAIDNEVGYLASALVLSAQMLGVGSSFTPGSPAKIMDAIFAAAPQADPDLLPPPLRTFREFAVAEKGKSSRETLQKLILRRTSYTQGGGADAGIDTPRILRSLKAFSQKPVVPDQIPAAVVDFVNRLQALRENLDSLQTAVIAALPDTSEVNTNVRETVKAVEKTFKTLQTFAMVPGHLDVAAVNRLGENIDASDLQHVAKLRQNLDEWDALSNLERLQALSGDWPSSAAKLQPWISSVTAALDAVEATVDSKIDPELKEQVETIDSALTSSLDAALKTLGSVVGSEQPS
jgi:hypothetical protein